MTSVKTSGCTEVGVSGSGLGRRAADSGAELSGTLKLTRQ